MSKINQKLHYETYGKEEVISLYSSVLDVGSNHICVKDTDGALCYAKVVPLSDKSKSGVLVKQGGVVMALAYSALVSNILTLTDLYEHYPLNDNGWFAIPNTILTVDVPAGGARISVTNDIYFWQDDGPSSVSGKLVVDSETEICKFTTGTGWHGYTVPGTNRDNDYTVTQAVWDALMAQNYLYHNTVTETIDLTAGIHSIQMFVTASGWKRAYSFANRFISIAPV